MDAGLDGMDWFLPGPRPTVQIWTPPLAAALTAVNQLSQARLKRPYDTTHVMSIPWLLYQEEWRSRFEKEMDIWFIVSCNDVWPHSAFEPLIVACPFHYTGHTLGSSGSNQSGGNWSGFVGNVKNELPTRQELSAQTLE